MSLSRDRAWRLASLVGWHRPPGESPSIESELPHHVQPRVHRRAVVWLRGWFGAECVSADEPAASLGRASLERVIIHAKYSLSLRCAPASACRRIGAGPSHQGLRSYAFKALWAPPAARKGVATKIVATFDPSYASPEHGRGLHTLREEGSFRAWFFSILLRLGRRRRGWWLDFLPLRESHEATSESDAHSGRAEWLQAPAQHVAVSRAPGKVRMVRRLGSKATGLFRKYRLAERGGHGG